MVMDAVRGYLQLASGLTDVTRARATEIARSLVTISRDAASSPTPVKDQVSNLAEEILAQSKANRDMVLGLVRTEVDRVLGTAGYVPAERVDELESRVDALAGELSAARATPSAPAPSSTMPKPQVSGPGSPAPEAPSPKVTAAAAAAATPTESAPTASRATTKKAPSAKRARAAKKSPPAPPASPAPAKASPASAKVSPASAPKVTPLVTAKKAPAKRAAATKNAAPTPHGSEPLVGGGDPDAATEPTVPSALDS